MVGLFCCLECDQRDAEGLRFFVNVNRTRNLSLRVLIALAVIPVFWMFIQSQGVLAELENLTIDWRMQARGDIPSSNIDVKYVNFDGATIKKFGEQPFPREVFAIVTEGLLAFGEANVVGIDFVFSDSTQSALVTEETQAYDSQQLFSVVQRFSDQVVLAAAYSEVSVVDDTDNKRVKRGFPMLYRGMTDPATNDLPETPGMIAGMNGVMGLINTDPVLSRGAVPRWVPLFAQSSIVTYEYFGYQILRLNHGLPPDAIKRDAETQWIEDADGRRIYETPLYLEQLVEVNYFTTWRSEKNPRFSMAEVFDLAYFSLYGEEIGLEEAQITEARAELKNSFRGSIVLIGPTDPLLQDLAPTSLDASPVPKVSVHGNLIKTIANGAFIDRFETWKQYVLLIGLTAVVAFCGIYGGKYFVWVIVGGFAVLALYVLTAFQLFASTHTVLPLVAPAGSALTTGLAGFAVRVLIEEREKSRIKGMFGSYVAPEVVNDIIEGETGPELGGVSIDITPLFSDIQGFSTFAEMLQPSDLIDLMNEYLDSMTSVMHQQGGTLDKYIGDAIVAMFGAPVRHRDHAYRACVASQLMQKENARLREKWEAEGDRWPDLVKAMRTRIGLHSGDALVGNMGSRVRFNYTMLGDTVNLAARLESGAKEFGVYTMVTGETKARAEAFGDACVFRFLDRIIVKGRRTPVEVFEIMCLRDDARDELLECVELYSQGIVRYLARDFEGAIAYFESSAKIEPLQPKRDRGIFTNPSQVLIQRCHSLKDTPPPEGWEGVFEMKAK